MKPTERIIGMQCSPIILEANHHDLIKTCVGIFSCKLDSVVQTISDTGDIFSSDKHGNFSGELGPVLFCRRFLNIRPIQSLNRYQGDRIAGY